MREPSLLQPREKLVGLIEGYGTARVPFDPSPRIGEALWAEPRLVAQVAFAEWTADGKLRQAPFLVLRTDKAPRECR